MVDEEGVSRVHPLLLMHSTALQDSASASSTATGSGYCPHGGNVLTAALLGSRTTEQARAALRAESPAAPQEKPQVVVENSAASNPHTVENPAKQAQEDASTALPPPMPAAAEEGLCASGDLTREPEHRLDTGTTQQAAAQALAETLAVIEEQITACVLKRDYEGAASLQAKAKEAARAMEVAEQVQAAAWAAHEEQFGPVFTLPGGPNEFRE